jgi:hypothetical protein
MEKDPGDPELGGSGLFFPQAFIGKQSGPDQKYQIYN